MTKSRIEIITETIISKSDASHKDAAWKYLRSESARAEAEMINVSHQAQMDIIGVISKIRAKSLAEYKTETAIKQTNDILGKMVGDSKTLATQMVTANILAGKVRALGAKIITGDELIKSISLGDQDKKRIETLVNQIVGRIQNGASLALTSVKNTIQNASNKANSLQLAQPKEEKKDGVSKEETQSPISNEFRGEELVQKNPRTHKQLAPTDKELEAIRRNPIVFANKASKANVTLVTKLREEYYRINNTPLNSSSDRKEANKEAKKDTPADNVAFSLGESLRKSGLFAFIDKGGKRWTLESYCAMTTRSVASQSTNLGEVFAREEHDLYYIVPHSGSCPLCKKYEGRVYSRSGNDKRYPPLASAFSKIDPNGSNDLDNTYWSIHPNCRHKIVRYVEKAHTPKQNVLVQAMSNRPMELTKGQEEQVRYYKERERVQNERNAALDEFKQYLQVMPPKDVCGNFIRFYEQKQKNSDKYKAIKKRYAELTKKVSK